MGKFEKKTKQSNHVKLLSDFIFRGSTSSTEKHAKEVCTCNADTENKWEELLHGEKRSAYQQMAAATISQQFTENTTVSPTSHNPTSTSTSSLLILNESPLDLWHQMEELTIENKETDNDVTDDNETNEGKSEEKTDSVPPPSFFNDFNVQLCNHVMLWMLEIFPPLLTNPYQITLENFLNNQINIKIKGLIQSNKDHEIAKKIEEKLEEDKEVLHIEKKELDKQIALAVKKQAKSSMKKNSLGAVATLSQSNTNDGTTGLKSNN